MPETPSEPDGEDLLDGIPLPMRIWAVVGWLVAVGLTYLGAYLLGWSLRPRGDARAPLFMLFPTLVYWPIATWVIWRLRAHRDT